MWPMKKFATTMLSASCFLGLLFIEPSAFAKKVRAHVPKAQGAEQASTFQKDTTAALRGITDELKTKLTQADLNGIKDDLKKVEQKADETAFEMKIVMLVGGVIALVLGVFINRLFARIRPNLSINP
jgi:hypothetical protein